MKKTAALLLLLAIAVTPAAKLTLETMSCAESQSCMIAEDNYPYAGDGCMIAEDEYPYAGTKQTVKKST